MKKVVWALDALQSDLPLAKRPFQFLKSLNIEPRPDVKAVYLLSSDMLNVGEGFENSKLELLKPTATRALESILRQLKAGVEYSVEVLTHTKHSLSASARALSDYARFEKADFILLSSHSRRGLKRLVLGSFAETLVQVSDVPVVVVGSQTFATPVGRSILFATDFSEQSRETLKQVVDLAQNSSARIRLLYVIPNPIEPLLQSGTTLLGGVWLPVENHFKEVKKSIKQTAANWIKECETQGVKAELVLREAKSSVSQEIIRESKKKPPLLLAMVAKSSTVTTFLIGSITREVLRSSPVAVWIFRKK